MDKADGGQGKENKTLAGDEGSLAKDGFLAQDGAQAPKVGSLEEKIDKLAQHMEKVRIAEYFELLTRPRRLFLLNFLAGMARGFGFAVGFTLLGALGIFILQSVVQLNLPLIGDFIAEIVEYVLESRGLHP